MADGDGCRCWASNAVECGCTGVDWTPQELIDARRTIAQLTARVAELEADMHVASAFTEGMQAQLVRLKERLRREATSAKAEAVQD